MVTRSMKLLSSNALILYWIHIETKYRTAVFVTKRTARYGRNFVRLGLPEHWINSRPFSQVTTYF